MRQIGTGNGRLNALLNNHLFFGDMDGYRRKPDGWIAQVFSAKAVERGAVVRRSVTIVEREVGRERFLDEVKKRGFHVIECGGQFVVICNNGRIRLIM